MHALVTSTLDFGNVALFGIMGNLIHRLEMVQRAAARVVLCIDRRDHRSMTAALRELHWLSIAQRIQCKVLTLMHGAMHSRTPRYLADQISTYAPSRILRSVTQSLAVVPRINLERYGRRAFSCAGPSLWNTLPLDLRHRPFYKGPENASFYCCVFEVILITFTCILYTDTFRFFYIFY